MALTVDASHAFIADTEGDVVDYMYLDAPRSRFAASYLERVIAGAKPGSFLGNAQQQMENDAAVATSLFVLAETAPDEAAVRALMTQAESRLQTLRSKIDGCYGGDPTDDEMNDCYEAAGIWNVTEELLGAMAWALVSEEPYQP